MFDKYRHHAPIPTTNNGVVALFGEVLVDVFPDRRVPGGAPFNVARHLLAFGLHPVLITRTGIDVLREELMATMTALGMDIRGVQSDPFHPTGQVMVHMANGAHRFEILPKQACDFINASHARMLALAVEPALVYFGTLAQRHKVSRQALGALLKSVEAPRLLDINLREPWYDLPTLKSSLAQADMVKLNNDELLEIARLLRIDTTDATRQAAILIEQFSLCKILVTCGAEGAWLLDAEGNVATLPAGESVEIVDTVGAGDGFASVFILGLFKNWPVEQTLLRADQFARSLCKIRGAVPPDDDFYKPFREAWDLHNGDRK
ncbi:MAG: carbohydrate kinase [Deltaproteobacteria bacterium CG_4_10_14_3_um_filter_60_8]|nr:MAG: carbohydrate kinase [Deltaproteobacteria bacterium CG_4_10_14_3_um_filter_60_8]